MKLSARNQFTGTVTDVVTGPVSAEVTATDHATMMREAEKLSKLAKNVCIKVPLTVDGLKTCKALTGDGIQVNVTLCFSAAQALLAAKAGATFQAGMAMGKFQGVIRLTTPSGSRVTSTVMPGRTEGSTSPRRRRASPAKYLKIWPARVTSPMASGRMVTRLLRLTTSISAPMVLASMTMAGEIFCARR